MADGARSADEPPSRRAAGRVLALPAGTRLPAVCEASAGWAAVRALREVAAAAVLDESRLDWYPVRLPPARRRVEPALRSATQLLDHSTALAPDRRLRAPPSPAGRVVGHCRHAAVLLCAALHAQGTPARVRAGFATYLGGDAGTWQAHWAVEHLHEGAWRRADAGLDDVQTAHLHIDFDAADLPRELFVPAPEAWRAVRAGTLPADRLHAGPWAGPATAVAAVVRDLAALTGRVPLPWDVWGCMPPPTAEPDGQLTRLVDAVAAVTRDPSSEDVRRLARHPHLRVPDEVLDGRTQRMVSAHP